MNYNKDVHIQLLRELDDFHNAHDAIFGGNALAVMLPKGSERSLAIQGYVSAALEAAEAARVDTRKLGSLLKAYGGELRESLGDRSRIKPKRAGESVESALKSILDHRREQIRAGLKHLPCGLGKAYTAVEDSVRKSSWISPANSDWVCFPELLELLESDSKVRELIDDAAVRSHLLSTFVPRAPRYWENEWSTGWVRFAERREPKHLAAKLRQTCLETEEEFRELARQVWAQVELVPVPAMAHVLREFWVASFSLLLRGQLQQLAGRLLRDCLSWQQPNGAWPASDGSGPCIESTAFAVGCLQRYGDGHTWGDSIRKGIDWLLANPVNTGGWGPTNRRGSVGELNLVTTIATLDAARVDGIPLEHSPIRQAEAALFHHQHPTGVWIDARGGGEDYLTWLVLAYFQRRMQRTENMHPATSLGRGLLLKGQTFRSDAYAVDQVMALVALYHGLEYVLYGFLAAHDGEYRTKDGKTIGFDEALARFRTLAREKAWIASAAGLPYGTQLADLKAKRDEVIHRLGIVDAASIDAFIRVVNGFVARFDLPVLGYTLLD